MAASGRIGAADVLRWLVGIAALVITPAWAESGAETEGNLRFLRDGVLSREVDLSQLREACGAVEVEVDDPYYERKKRFLACPVTNVLTLGYGIPVDELKQESYLLRAADGFVKPVSGRRLFGGGGFVAFADSDLTGRAPGPIDPVWEPIDRRQVDPGPFYMVWEGVSAANAHAYPWPYQLVEFEIASLETFYPHIAPRGVAEGSAAQEGYSLFVENCIACHAVNGEGGKVGPDLNIPRNIVEYRPIEQVKAYIRNPASFRYTTMPAHEYLTDSQLDALVAYFGAMKARKFDPERLPAPVGRGSGQP